MEKITITSIKKVAREGKTTFWSCETINGSKYTVWDSEIAANIEKNLNIECEVETKQSGDFWNIRAFAPSNVTPMAEKIEVNPSEKRKSVKGSAYEKDPVGLAVECFVALITETNEAPETGGKIMDTCIKLVKQAQEAFN